MRNDKCLALFIAVLQVSAISQAASGGKDIRLQERVNTLVSEAGMIAPARDVPGVVPQAPTPEPRRVSYRKPPDISFERLQELYSEGILPSTEAVTGWFAGRCYLLGYPYGPDINRPEEEGPLGALLVGMRGTPVPGGGADSSSPTDFRMTILVKFNGGAYFFDSLTKRQESEISAVMDSVFKDQGVATETGGALSSKYEKGLMEYRIRRHGSYLIGNIAVFKNGPVPEDGGMCYFFKKVR